MTVLCNRLRLSAARTYPLLRSALPWCGDVALMIANFTFSTARANDRNSLLGTLSCSGWLHSFWGFGGSLRLGFGVDRRVSVGFGSEFSGGVGYV